MMTVGVLGGMGPAATVDFFARVVRATPAATEQQHLHLIIDNNPGVPNRNLGVAGTGPSPGPALAQMARRLEQAGADFLVMPCNTAHAFVDDIHAATRLPFINMVDETILAVKAQAEAGAVGLLAADGCLIAGLYQNGLDGIGRTPLLLDAPDQQRFMSLLYRIKAGETDDAVRETMREFANTLIRRGARVIVAACTEVPIVLAADAIDVPLVSSTDVLVDRTIERATNSASA
jgi:aspartate racemase